ncbi:MAG: tRNA uridine-5-carboxymethylaminomethyl(34) synthesis GTPase MnmE [Clostridia bacterium]|nr:tRNA uridine-5-carboxymethylaminomethyl(34) synthesis GTPase MnmE [Clostridia bacterium]
MENVISALSTPMGKGGIAVIRVSGKGAIEVCQKMFCPVSGKTLSDLESNKAIYGRILFEGEEIDDGIATVFRAPASFTGEDTVEICCHGGILLSQKVLRSTYLCGSAPAKAGEFTQRAFMNGKLSLSEAEAVIDLIDAENSQQLKLAHSRVKGVLAKQIDELREMLLSLISSVYVFVDYPEEDLSDVSVESALLQTENMLKETNRLLATYETGKIISDGVSAVICGKPNTGKSSLLNALAQSDRAIVTSVAGTTRDTVEEKVNIGSITLNLCDTAGIHDTDDEVEKLGIERSVSKMKEAQLVLCVLDSSGVLEEEDKKVIQVCNTQNTVIVLNKTDLGNVIDKTGLAEFENIVEISAKNGEGIDELRSLIEKMFLSEAIDYNSAIISNERQFSALCRAKESMENAKRSLMDGYTPDIASMELELALACLGEIDSRKASEEVVSAIFSRFCIGK